MVEVVDDGVLSPRELSSMKCNTSLHVSLRKWPARSICHQSTEENIFALLRLESTVLAHAFRVCCVASSVLHLWKHWSFQETTPSSMCIEVYAKLLGWVSLDRFVLNWKEKTSQVGVQQAHITSSS